MIFSHPAIAASYIPSSDQEVLEVLPQPAGLSTIRTLQQAHQRTPEDKNIVYQLIDATIALGRQEGDPRYYGYAEAMVKPLLAQPSHQTDVRLLLAEANILQHRHDFDGALVRLNRILRLESALPQAHIMRAIIEIPRGDYRSAMADCRAVLSPAYGTLLGITCVSLVNGLTGSLPLSYTRLSQFYHQFEHQVSDEERSWALSVLGEMAVRLGKPAESEQYFKAALKVNSKDYYVMAAYADLLLSLQRPDEVISLLDAYQTQDNLLLRLCLAEQQRSNSKDTTYSALMKERIAASLERKEVVHLRDYARFSLDIEGNAASAYRMAKENWNTQKEPQDARILIESALAVGEKDTAHEVLLWQREHHYQDAAFDRYKDL